MRKLGATLGAILCAVTFAPLTLISFESVAHAQTVPGKEHAKKLFEDGLELEKKADYAAALTKYKEAAQITATAGLRFHEGYCLEQTGKLSAALEAYEVADKLARDQGKQDVHAAVIARLEPLRARTPQIAIRLATPAKDVEVQLDGVVVGAPLLDGTAFRLDPGEHQVNARAPGFKPFSRKVRVPESITTTVDISLERAAVGPVPPPAVPATPAGEPAKPPPENGVTEPPSEAPRHRSIVLPVATTAGAVVLLGTGVAMFVVAGGKQSDAQRDCPMLTTCDGAQRRVRTFDALALGGFIGAAALGVVSIVLWTSKGPEKAAHSLHSTRFTATSRGALVEGTFW